MNTPQLIAALRDPCAEYLVKKENLLQLADLLEAGIERDRIYDLQAKVVEAAREFINAEIQLEADDKLIKLEDAIDGLDGDKP